MDSPSTSRQASGPNNPHPPASDSQWRTTCRTCGSSFKSRNQLMRHLYRAHPGKPGRPKASSKQSRQVQPPAPPDPETRKPKPEQSQSQVHPFNLLSQHQRITFAARILFVLFFVGMKQMEDEQRRQQDQAQQLEQGEEPHRERHQDRVCSQEPSRPWEPILGPSKDGATPTSDSGPSDLNLALEEQHIPLQTHQGKLSEESELEDSDEDDGGVALFGPKLGNPPLRLHDEERGMDWDVGVG